MDDVSVGAFSPEALSVFACSRGRFGGNGHGADCVEPGLLFGVEVVELPPDPLDHVVDSEGPGVPPPAFVYHSCLGAQFDTDLVTDLSGTAQTLGQLLAVNAYPVGDGGGVGGRWVADRTYRKIGGHRGCAQQRSVLPARESVGAQATLAEACMNLLSRQSSERAEVANTDAAQSFCQVKLIDLLRDGLDRQGA